MNGFELANSAKYICDRLDDELSRDIFKLRMDLRMYRDDHSFCCNLFDVINEEFRIPRLDQMVTNLGGVDEIVIFGAGKVGLKRINY